MRELKEFKTQEEVIEFLGKDLPMKFICAVDNVVQYETVSSLKMKNPTDPYETVSALKIKNPTDQYDGVSTDSYDYYEFKLEVFYDDVNDILGYADVDFITGRKQVFTLAHKRYGEANYTDVYFAPYEATKEQEASELKAAKDASNLIAFENIISIIRSSETKTDKDVLNVGKKILDSLCFNI